MTRTARRKVYYFSFVAIGSALLVGGVLYFHVGIVRIAFLLVALHIPGWILGFFWRDQLAGLRLLNQKRFEESARRSRRFLDSLTKHPWIRHLIWLGSGTYSRDPRSIALNNLGAAEMHLGEFEAARQHLEDSCESDAENPLPYFNLARLHLILGDSAKGEEFLADARRLGYSQGLTDKLIRAAQSRFAHTTGTNVR